MVLLLRSPAVLCLSAGSRSRCSCNWAAGPTLHMPAAAGCHHPLLDPSRRSYVEDDELQQGWGAPSRKTPSPPLVQRAVIDPVGHDGVVEVEVVRRSTAAQHRGGEDGGSGRVFGGLPSIARPPPPPPRDRPVSRAAVGPQQQRSRSRGRGVADWGGIMACSCLPFAVGTGKRKGR